MADLTYDINIDTSPAQKNLNALTSSVDKLSDRLKNINVKGIDALKTKVSNLSGSFDKLKTAIAGAVTAGTAGQILKFADEITDLSDATGIAVKNVLGFTTAVSQSGGSIEGAKNVLNTFVKTIGEAADGGKEVQSAFRDAGISIKDLQTLSEKDLLQKTIDGLSKIEDRTKRVNVATQLFGKGIKGVDVEGLAVRYGPAVADSIKYEQALKELGNTADKLALTFLKIQLAVARSLEPLAKIVNDLPQEKLDEFIQGVLKIGAALAALAIGIPVLTKVGEGIAYLGGAMATAYALFKVGTGGIVTALGSIGKTIEITIGYITRFFKATPMFASANGPITNLLTLLEKLIARIPYVGAAFVAMGVGLLRMIPYIGLLVTGIYALNEALKALTGNSLGDWFDIAAEKLEAFVSEKFPKIAAAINWLNEKLGMGPPPSVAAAAKKENDNEMARLRARIDAVKKANEAEAARREVIDRNAQELAKFGLQLKQQNELTYLGLQHARDKISTEANLINLQAGENRLSEGELEILKAQMDASDEKLQKLIQIRQEVERLQSEMKMGSKDETLPGRIKMLQDQAKEVENTYNKHIELLPEYMRKLQTAKMLEEDRQRTLENINKAIEAQIQRQQTLGDILVSANDKLKDVQFAGEQQKRSPLQQQMAQIQEDSRKAALEAGRAYAAQFEGMDLTTEQAAELAAGLQQIADRYKVIADEQTKQLEYSRTWEAGWKEAFDAYMENATNAARMAGDAFRTITSNMESAIDKFVETGKFSFGDFARSVLQDLAKMELKFLAAKWLKGDFSFGGGLLGSIFGFANGGTPPVNKPSLVGEQGPELFVPKTSGTIIPNDKLGGSTQVSAPIHNTYITNNISALDAKSVAQLFAENRKTLLGTVQMAQKELPYANR